MKYNAGNKKYLLKQITHKYVPQNLLDRPKSGFSIPIFEWLKGDLKEYLLEYITEEELAKHGYINIKEAIKIRDGFLAGKSGNEIQVWLILMFQLWWRRWM
jgi:asparagine synthase (glutamine-hydrolysing)